MTLNVITASGILDKGVQKWKAEDEAHKTIANFKVDFAKYHKSYLQKRSSDKGIAHNVQQDHQVNQQVQLAKLQSEKINELITLKIE